MPRTKTVWDLVYPHSGLMSNHVLIVCYPVSAMSHSSFQLTESYVTRFSWKSNKNHCTHYSFTYAR